jgi:hypothetical protein
VLPLHFTIAGDELLLHLARPNPVWPHLAAVAEVRLAVTGDYAYIPTYAAIRDYIRSRRPQGNPGCLCPIPTGARARRKRQLSCPT